MAVLSFWVDSSRLGRCGLAGLGVAHGVLPVASLSIPSWGSDVGRAKGVSGCSGCAAVAVSVPVPVPVPLLGATVAMAGMPICAPKKKLYHC